MLKEFREFINRGNVIDLAVAVVMGAAFGAIVTSLVNDIMMPTVGVITQSLNFSSLALRIGATQIAYGKFMQAVTTFLLISLVSFLLVRMVNRMQERLMSEKIAAPTNVPADIQLLTEIRDLLKSRSLMAAGDCPANAEVIESEAVGSFRS